MFAIPGLLLLIVFDYFKPQEYVPALASVPFLYLFVGFTVLGFIVDLKTGVSRLTPSPLLLPTILLAGWCLLSTSRLGARMAWQQGVALLIPIGLCLLTAHVVQTFRMVRVLLVLLLGIGLSLAVIGVEQRFAPWGCHAISYGTEQRLIYDGRACSPDAERACNEGAEPGVEYACERVGLFGTSSIRGRVRFRGTIEDPNELALFTAIVLPIAFALFERRRSMSRFFLAAASTAAIAACIVFTQSRGGQLVFVIVLGIYFARQFGARGLLAGAVCVLPILVLGGRSTGEAAASSMERIEAWAMGMHLLRTSPLLGVGVGQFTEHYYLTAHNSYVLTAAEIGFPGMVIWTALLYVSMKITVTALRHHREDATGAARTGSAWSLAIFAALAGTLGGMLFLSYAYKESLWIWLGVSGALYQAIHRHDPTFRVRMRPVDFASIVGVDVLLIVTTTAYTRLKLGF